jgi:DNA-binding transcriptional ArsR family regulator
MHGSPFDALSDPSRRRIVEVLKGGDRAVNDIVDKCEIDQSGVSRHLRILGEAGFVEMRKDGQRRIYSLRKEPFDEMERWLNQYRLLWEMRLDRFAQALEKKQKARKEKK